MREAIIDSNPQPKTEDPALSSLLREWQYSGTSTTLMDYLHDEGYLVFSVRTMTLSYSPETMEMMVAKKMLLDNSKSSYGFTVKFNNLSKLEIFVVFV